MSDALIEKTPESCTCGATLVANARFCHRCGRPVFDEVNTAEVVDSVDLSTAPVSPQTTVRPASLPVGFGNPIAMRVAFLMSLAIVVMQLIPGLNVLFVVWWLAAGWGGVLLYRRLTGLALSVKAGARLGSITGVLTFVSMAVIFSFSLLFTGKELFQEMVKQNPQISQFLNDPASMIAAMLMVLVLIFAMVVGTCAAGGALGAKFAGRGSAG
jgi:hypothetical protein